MTPQKLYRLSGFGLIGGGVLFAIGNLLHPLQHNVEAYAYPTWTAAHILFSLGAALMAISLAGFFAWQAQRAGWLGLIGYIMTGLGLVYLPIGGYFEAFIAPTVGADLVAAIQAQSGAQDGIAGLVYLLGHVILGIATVRARVFPRPASLVLLLGIITLVIAAPFTSKIAGLAIISGTVIVAIAFIWYGAFLYRANLTAQPAALATQQLSHAA
ncbi:MAG TPA: hypothetical protein VIL85_20525 [Thermomicrobiales bacterium]|jgi:hypothetical protein